MAEEFKSIAYTQKDIQNLERQYTTTTKFLRALRNHEKRLQRLEKQAGLTISPNEDSERLLEE